jgi:serine/threonine-protein kinase
MGRRLRRAAHRGDVFDEPLTAVFEVQSAIAGKVIDEMNLTLVGSAAADVEQPTQNMEAYDAYLRGVELIYRLQDVQRYHREASAEFLRAIELDPNFAEAVAAMSIVHSDLFWFGEPTEEHRRKSYDYGVRALELDPNSAGARHAMGMYYYHCELDYDHALEELEAALRIQPNHAEAIAGVAYVNRRKGNFEAAAEYLRKTTQLDPRFHHYYYELGETLVDMRRYEDAMWYLDKALELMPTEDDPRHGPGYWKALAHVLWKGDTDAARRVVAQVIDASTTYGRRFYVSQTHGWLDILDRRYEDALSGLQAAGYDAETDHGEFRPRTQMIAEVYWLMGDRDKARVYADSARALAEERLAETPGDARLHSCLGRTYAMMGEKTRALEAARKAVELMPISRDAKRGAWREGDLVMVLIHVGEAEEALDLIEHQLSIPAAHVSVPMLKVNPVFDPLRDHPRFKALVEG